MPDELVDPATAAIHACIGAGLTVATAESLTGGLVCAALTSVPGSSAVVRGGVITYATELKAGLAGVDTDDLARNGPVHPDTARAMARGVRQRLGADVGIATTGVAGPDPQDGQPVGLVYVALAGANDAVVVRELHLDGDRAAIRTRTVEVALALLTELADSVHGSRTGEVPTHGQCPVRGCIGGA